MKIVRLFLALGFIAATLASHAAIRRDPNGVNVNS
jgi:hypothetical protein